MKQLEDDLKVHVVGGFMQPLPLEFPLEDPPPTPPLLPPKVDPTNGPIANPGIRWPPIPGMDPNS